MQKFNAVDYEKIRYQAKRVIDGTSLLRRFNRQEENGRIAGGKTNVEAALVARAACFPFSGSDNSANDAAKQTSALKEYCEWIKSKTGKTIWYSSDDISKIEHKADLKTGGAEADVYLMPERYVIKIVEHSCTPLEFLDDRISLYNYLFPETKYELIGFANNPFDETFTTFILKQKQVEGKTILQWLADISKADRDIAEVKMKEYIIKKMLSSFNAIPAATDNTYKNDNYYIRDLHWENVMTIDNPLEFPNTHLFVVDTNTSLNTITSDGGIREYGDYAIIPNQ